MIFRFDGFKHVNISCIESVSPQQTEMTGLWRARYRSLGFEDLPLGPSFDAHAPCATWIGGFLIEAETDIDMLRADAANSEMWKRRALAAEEKLAEIESHMIEQFKLASDDLLPNRSIPPMPGALPGPGTIRPLQPIKGPTL